MDCAVGGDLLGIEPSSVGVPEQIVLRADAVLETFEIQTWGHSHGALLNLEGLENSHSDYPALMDLSVDNPFALPSTLPYELPPFAKIRNEHYLPAFYAGMAQQLAEVEDILENDEPATLENTLVALEASGQLLKRVLMVFFNNTSSDTSEELDEMQAEIAPKFTAHQDSIQLDPRLWAKVQDLYSRRESLNLNEEDAWLLQRSYEDLRQAGAHLDDAQRARLTEINAELASLETEFGRKLLADTNDLAVLVEDVSKLAGLGESEVAAAKAAAEARNLSDKWLIPMVNFTGHPWLANLTDRDLREEIFTASLTKGLRGNENDTRATLLKMVALRSERATLFSVANHAEQVLASQTAKSPARVHEMLRKIAPAAVANARRESEDLQAAVNAAGHDFEVAAWDWDLFTEKVRAEKYNLDVELLKPYFELEKVLVDGVFFAAEKLYGITFTERKDLIAYHPDARVYEVKHEDGSPLGLYIADCFTRDSKRGGAWMNNLVDQNFLLGQLPVVVNNLNVPKPPAGAPALLTLDETTTLFHEFGHALHGLLSKVKYPRFSGTSVQRDFVEFPSQVNEMWMLWPEVVDNYAIHHETGERLPQEWINRLQAAESFNQGHATTSYLAAAILDLAWHSLTADSKVEDVEEFERAAIADYGLDFSLVPTRYRSTYFAHIFDGGYSAGYYGYIWSEVLDADTVDWFKENGGLTRKNGQHFVDQLLGRGGSVDSMEMFRNFRGRDAEIQPLLKRRGLL